MEKKILEISNRRKLYEIKYNDLIIEFITKAYELVELSNEVYQDNNVDLVIKDTIKLIKKNAIDKQKDILVKRIREYTVITEEDAKQLDILIKQKMELDKQLQALL